MRPVLALLAAFGGAALAQEPAPAPAAAPECRTIQEPTARLACYDAREAAAAAAPEPPQERFGLPQATDEGELHARVVGKVEYWTRGARFTLDNGQVWRALEGSRVYYTLPENPQVVISRSVFGAYWMQFVDTKVRVKVKRTS